MDRTAAFEDVSDCTAEPLACTVPDDCVIRERTMWGCWQGVQPGTSERVAVVAMLATALGGPSNLSCCDPVASPFHTDLDL